MQLLRLSLRANDTYLGQLLLLMLLIRVMHIMRDSENILILCQPPMVRTFFHIWFLYTLVTDYDLQVLLPRLYLARRPLSRRLRESTTQAVGPAI